ncbi:hypothetical protein [Siansivirga zeaxanthinifaciens]|uniref:Uncharacterized protein n=1 Tax=Siansivirga zeaxanthinifaciens CC-SAMT-1 TaxID=1454006 RepID=A0A0C5WPE7_9FLAO|nr:hypothetical protein [Siansivirga zeaxanthinifaciens]AJR04765.1 hypothetical protein AW14_03670 [Siansivirga zeaxanthinifaciens CC-SAMT-1]
MNNFILAAFSGLVLSSFSITNYKKYNKQTHSTIKSIKKVSDDVFPLKTFYPNIKHQLTSYGVKTGSSGNLTTMEAFGVGSKKYGIKHTAKIVESSYSYVYARIGDSLLYNDVSSQKIRFVIEAEAACEFMFRMTNGSTWGSENGTIGKYVNQLISFTEENNYTQEIEIDMASSEIANFYSNPVRSSDSYQKVYFIITANEGSKTPIGTHILRYYAFNTSQKISDENLSFPQIYEYAITKQIEKAKEYANNQIHDKLPEQSYTSLNFDNFLLRGGNLVTIEKLSRTKFRLKKELGVPNSYIAGLYIVFNYEDLLELNKDLTIILKKTNNSHSLNSFHIMDNLGDWGVGNKAINLSSSISEGTNKINLYDLIMTSSNKKIINYYSGANTLTLSLAIYNSGFSNNNLKDVYLDYELQFYYENENVLNIANELNQSIKDELIVESAIYVTNKLGLASNYITCWGDSLTASGGWTAELQSLSGMTVYNGATGGENVYTIPARQGGDVMIVNNITIPATRTPVLIADRDIDGGIKTQNGYIATPLLQGGDHVNPCYIGDIKGTLEWTGSGHADITGDWVFTRAESGNEVVINRPTAIRTDFDINKNNPHLQVIFMGQNGGYKSLKELVKQHRLMIEHSRAKHTIVLGSSSGSTASRAEYENTMKSEFGRYFISLREYLSTPIYDKDGTTIISCYGLDDAGLTPTQSDLDLIAIGQVPSQLLTDGIHYTLTAKKIIGNMLYKKCKDLNIF